MHVSVPRLEDSNRFRLDETFLAQYRDRQPQWGPLGYVTYLRTYSRPIYDETGKLVRNEEFVDTLERVTNGTFSYLKQQVRSSGQHWDEAEAQVKAAEFFTRMWQFKWLPPGRGLWMMGTDYVEQHGSAALQNCGFVATNRISYDFSGPFCEIMDYSMLGVGMGFDVSGTGMVRVQEPERSGQYVVADTREGWVDVVRTTLNAYVGLNPLPTFDYSRVRPEGSPIRGFGGTASGPAPLKELVAFICETLDGLVGQFLDETAITDIANCIGRCVVAGNVRRSSEIAISDHTDVAFRKLKDPTDLYALVAEQQAIQAAIPEWAELEEQKKPFFAKQDGLSVLDPLYLELQVGIDAIEAQQKEILRTNLDWRRVEKRIQETPLRHHRWASNNSINCDVIDGRYPDYQEIGRQIATNGEPGIIWLDVMRTRGRIVDAPIGTDHRVAGCNPCSEQQLEDGELCCLVETFPTNHENLDDYLLTLKYAFLYAKVVTCIPTHNARTNAVIARNRRIGTSQAGIAEMYQKLGLRECVRWWDSSYAEIQRLDESYSGWMGAPRSIRTTSVKPGGTVPLLAGVEGGMKFVFSRYQFRTIRIDHLSPLVARLRAAGYRVEPDRTTPRSVVCYFPIEQNVGRYARDVTMWEQVALLAALQAHWSDNMVSATITFQPHEVDDIGRVLEVYEGRLKSISFLPLSDHGYVQAPYIPCTQAEYEAAVARIVPVDFSDLNRSSTHEASAEERFCSGGICEIPIANNAE